MRFMRIAKKKFTAINVRAEIAKSYLTISK